MMEAFPQKISDFIKKHHVLTLATCEDNQPWCFNAFYAYDEANHALVFSSGDDTKHVQQAVRNPRVSGSIVLETEMVGKIQGLQFSGELARCQDEDEKSAKKIYIKRFPFATLAPKTLWRLPISVAKFTDNTLGFGKKLVWEEKF